MWQDSGGLGELVDFTEYNWYHRNMTSKQTIFKWAVIVGIVVLLNLFYNVGVSLYYPEPQFDDYCAQKQTRDPIHTEALCLETGGQWNPSPVKAPGDPQGYCNEFFTCSVEHEEARDIYNQNVFSILVALGVIPIIVVSTKILAPYAAVTIGLSYGGILSIIIAGIRYWPSAPDTIRFALVGIALVALLIVAARKFRD